MPRQSSMVNVTLLVVLVLAHLAPITLAHPYASPQTQEHQQKQQQQTFFEQDIQQLPFDSQWSHTTKHSSKNDGDATVLFAGQELPSETFTLKHLLHHGGNKFRGLFRRLDVDENDLRLSELRSGNSHRHTLKVRATKTLKPLDQSYRNQGFRSFDTSIGPGSWTREVIAGPDIEDKDTIIELGKINYNSYMDLDSPGWYDLEGHWNVNSTFGWEEEGVRGHVFASSDNNTLIISVKGTSTFGGGSTTTRDKINDNLLFSCCCAKVDRTWRGVCDCNTGGYQCDQRCVEDSVNSDEVYYNIAIMILWTVQDMYPGANIWLSGHSLGGSLTALLGLTFGIPTVTFEPPGDMLPAKRLHLPMPPAIDWYELPLFHFGHTADPVFMGVCNGPSSTCYYTGYAME
ncbi:putative lipase atg15, partial [Entomortierella lignicola]